MSKALRISAACCLAALLTSAGSALPGIAGAQTEEGQPAAWILVDGESGVVLDGVNVHEPRPAAGTATMMTALVTVQRLPIAPLDRESVNPVLVSREAARAPQPRLGISQGARWDVQKLLNGILLSDSNDAAWALAETASGNLAAFAGEMNAFGMRLGLRDSTWADPLGDDDDTATPNLTSAWDLAVVARAILRVPELKRIVSDPEETINGPQLGKRVVNENDLVHRYLGATGLKQASSDKAGSVLVGSAERDGRSFIVVALGTNGDPVSFAVEKLDAAFDTGASAATKSGVAGKDAAVRPRRIASAQARLEALVNLPPVLGRPALAPGAIGSQAPPTPSTTVPTTQPRRQEAKDSGSGGGGLITLTNFLIALLFSGLVVVIVLRRRAIVMKQRRRVVRQRSFNEAKRRGTIDFIDPDQVAGTSHVKIVRPGERDHRES